MEIFDILNMQAEGYEKRQVNVFYQNELFKVRVVSLEKDGKIPKCEMDSYVMFYVVEGQITLTRNDESSPLTVGQCFITEPAFVSMTSSYGAKLLGIQIKIRE